MVLTEHMTWCAVGHRHWGAIGAAGLLIRHTDSYGETWFLLQQRSSWVHHGDTWSTPGGAIRGTDTPEQTAYTETVEEMGLIPDVTVAYTYTDDHGGWAYHTVVADVDAMFDPPSDGDGEQSSAGWFTADQVGDLPLHPGFAATWTHLRDATMLNLTQ